MILQIIHLAGIDVNGMPPGVQVLNGGFVCVFQKNIIYVLWAVDVQK